MASSSPLNFANQDLRNRSFKGQNLNGANFSGCDLRGCDFSHALLQDANFERVKTGQTPRQFIPSVVLALVIGLLSADGFSKMIFGLLGRTPAEGGWSFVIALGVSLAISGIFSGLRVMMRPKSLARRIATIISGATSGALLGFFYGGSTTDNNVQFAIAGAVLGGVLMALICWRVRHPLVAVAVAAAGGVAGYGFAFFTGATAIAYLSAQKLVWGVFWGALSLGYIGLTMNSLILVVREIRHGCGTSFRRADLTNAKFDRAILQNTDFSGALGSNNFEYS
ncbi:pentapeptide repeat-containing protein [Allocoleopsis franciscana]|uniref:Putative low-complexity protein n=1 Tax=Allocoleopsis franciscana PCC 7113 TaxID=1173027 RepID=K9WNJ0_9CYAN|nr:pentapeptide repeat-containing protein [Allocoleopsis franciscana]AFZ21753.1 putative low-complexity protein [Allocoleopsis franciscana PCC 7113]